MPAGRPSSYTPEIAALICDLIVQGKSVRKICSLESMPCITTVMDWLRDKPQFTAQYTRAKELQAEGFADELMDIADDDSGDVTGELQIPNSVAVQRSKLRYEARKWVVSRLLAKKYGDKVQQEITGADGGALIVRHIGKPSE